MNEEFSKLLEEYFREKENKKGIVKGKIIKINGKDVFIDYGGKSEGIVPLDEFEKIPKIGEEIEVAVIEPETEDGYALLSIETVRQKRKWEKIAEKLEKEKYVKGIIKQKVRGGFKVDIGSGIYTFLPLSQVDIIPVRRPDDWLDKEIKAKVVSIDKKRQSIVISRRQVIEEERKRKRKKLIKELKEGDIRTGKVKNIVDFGIFVDVDGIDGLIHKSDISWSGLKSPFETAKIGQIIKVKIIKIDREKERLFLSLKRLTEDPWNKIEKKVKEGKTIEGTVTKLSSKGIFVELSGDIAGFVPAEKLKGSKLKEKKRYKFKVAKIDKENRRVVLECLEKEPLK